MCGIAGYVSTSRFSRSSILDVISGPILYRGPDNFSHYYCGTNNLLLCHSRLSIIDLSSLANQPFSSPCGRYHIVFNGEIFNYRELRSLLVKLYGIKFSTSSDTEVLLYLLIHFPLNRAVSMLDGMYAFTFYDSCRDLLFVSRDPVGEKPLYYLYEPSCVFAFSSSPRSLTNLPFFSGCLSESSIYSFFSLGSVPGSQTLFSSVKRVLPGQQLMICLRSMSLEIVQSDKCQIYPNTSSFSHQIDDLRNLLISSVSSRLNADVPVGFFLSGGIDSSLLASIASLELGQKITTFSLGSTSDSELPFAAKVSSYLNTIHNEIQVSQDHLDMAFSMIPEIYDDPISDPSIIPTILLHRFAKPFSTVFLGGDGADEFFGGYNRYIFGLPIFKFLHHFSYLYPSLSRINISFLGRFALPFVSRFLSAFGVLSLSDRLTKLRQLNFGKSFEDFYISAQGGYYNSSPCYVYDFLENLLADMPVLNSLRSLMRLDQGFYLPDVLLVKSDRSSMFNGLEVRSPFLSNELISFALSLPSSSLVHNFNGKVLLRSLLRSYLPPELFRRPKMGFTIPLASYLQGPGSHLLAEYVTSDMFDLLGDISPLYQSMLSSFLEGDKSFFKPVFSLLVFSMSIRSYSVS